MDRASVLLVNIKRDMEPGFLRLLEQNGVTTVFSSPCKGTAGKTILSLLGLEKTERTLILAVTKRAKAARAMREMVSAMGINLPGYGIAMCLPVGSIGGARSMQYLMGEQKDETDEVKAMDEKREFPYDLIIAISQRDTSDQVMAAARSAGAGGGTIVHAKGAGAENAARFLGVSLVDEREILLIAIRHEKKDAVMRAIMEKAGIRSEAHAVVFSVPVEDIVGLRSLMNPETEPPQTDNA